MAHVQGFAAITDNRTTFNNTKYRLSPLMFEHTLDLAGTSGMLFPVFGCRESPLSVESLDCDDCATFAGGL